MRKKYGSLLLLAAALTLAACREKESIPVSPDASSLEEEDPSDVPGDLQGEEIPVYEVELPEDLSSFSAAIWGEVYEFPMSWEEFAGHGWTRQGSPEQTVDSRSYLEGETFEKDGNILQAYILNPEPETLPAEKCSIAGIRVDTGTPEGKNIYINLPGGIVMGQSLEENVTEPYGEPVDRYQGEEGMVLTYEYGTYRSVTLGFDGEAGVLRSLDLKNTELPEEETLPAQTVPSEEVLEYRRPEGPGEKLADAVVQYDGVYYRLPVPVREMEARGWILNRQESDEILEAGQYGHGTLEKGGARLYTVLRNSGEETAASEDCLVTSLTGDLDTVKVPIVLAGGITLGMQEEAFLLAVRGEEYEKTENLQEDTAVYTFFQEGSQADYTEITLDGSLKLIREIRVVCNQDRELDLQTEE